MSQVQAQPTLVEQVVNAIVSEIVDGELPSNSRLIQDELARAYGVGSNPGAGNGIFGCGDRPPKYRHQNG